MNKKQKALLQTIGAITFIITVRQFTTAINFQKVYTSSYPHGGVIETKIAGEGSQPTTLESQATPSSPETSQETPETPEQLKERIAQKGKEVFGEQEAQYLVELVDRESDFRPTAKNPQSTAYGLFQFLDGTWEAYGGTKTSDPEKQIELGIKYIAQRYGTPSKAIAFHNVNNWY